MTHNIYNQLLKNHAGMMIGNKPAEGQPDDVELFKAAIRELLAYIEVHNDGRAVTLGEQAAINRARRLVGEV